MNVRITLLGLLLSTGAAMAAPPNPVVVDGARFTVVSPMCIRMEYSDGSRFVDQPSLFAVGRQARNSHFALKQTSGKTVIDTGTLRLTYTPDGKPFSRHNLVATIHRKGVSAEWTPGALNPGNLGGTIRTLDEADGPKDLGQGLLSRDGWFLLDDSKTPLLTSDWVQSRPATAGSDWYLFGYGHDYRGALKTLATIGGPVPLPRRYAMGAWYSRYWPYSSAEFRQVVAEYAQHDFPLDIIVLDMDWHRDGWTGWSWNRKLLPDAEKLLAWFHSQGLHDTLNLHPADGVAPHEDGFARFNRDMGAPLTGTIPFDAGSKKYMDTLFRDIVDPLEKNGVDFWWLDWQQYPFTRSVTDLTNLFWLNTLIYRHSAADGQRGLSFSRWGGWGDHRHPIHFSGDASTSFQMLAFEVPFTSIAGNVGCFFWSHDIGGHNRGRNEESYARWVQFGATSAALRSHSTRDATMDRRPWLYQKWATDSMRISFHLRDALFPYLYSSAAQSARETVPLNRPMYLDNPGLETAYHQAQEYMLGDNVLVAPIVSKGVGPRRVAHQHVWFPKGEWYNHFTGERYTAGEALVAADIDEFPIYVRGGVPVPMQPYTPRMATTPLKTLIVRVYPGSQGQSSLYEDDGVSTGYRHGLSASTSLGYKREGNTVTITVGAARGHYPGQVVRRDLLIELPDTGRASRVEVDGQPASASYAELTNRVHVAVRPVGQPTTIRLTLASVDLSQLRAKASMRRMAGVTGKPVASLRQALNQCTDSAQRDEVLAAVGVGLVHHNLEPYLFGGSSRDEFYASDCVEGEHGMRTVFGATVVHRGHRLRRQAQVHFRIFGQSFTQPSKVPQDELLDAANLAASARVSASASEEGSSPEGAVDGRVGGYPGDRREEWASGSSTGWLQLDWDQPQSLSRVVLYDRPSLLDQATAGTLTFSDGTSVPVAALPDDGATGLTVTFPSRQVTWVRFTATASKEHGKSVGLAEIAAFR